MGHYWLELNVPDDGVLWWWWGCDLRPSGERHRLTCSGARRCVMSCDEMGNTVCTVSLLMPTTMPVWSYWVWGVMCWIGLMILWASTRNLLDPEAGSFQGRCNEHGCVPPDLLWKFPAFHWLLKELTCKLDRVPEEVCPLLLFYFPPSPDVLCSSKSGKPSSDLIPVKCLVCHPILQIL